MATIALPDRTGTGAAAAIDPLGTLVATRWRAATAPAVRTAWDALAACAAEPNPFAESWFMLPALRALDPREQVRLLRFEVDGDMAGLLPLVRESRYYGWRIPHLSAWVHPNAFLGVPLVAAGLEHRFWRALLAWADGNARLGLFLHLPEVPLHGPMFEALGEVLEEQGRTAGIVHRTERAMLASGKSPEAYFAEAMTGKKRKELRRQLARLGEQGDAQFDRQVDGEGLKQWTTEFLALEAAGWKGEAGSALGCRKETARMFRAILKGAAARGKLERLALRLDGKPVAMLANLVTPPGLFSFKTAYDESLARYSPGVLLQCENLMVLDRPEIAWSDSCAAADHPMIDRIWRERRAVGRISIAIGGPVRRALFHKILAAELARNPAGVAP